MCECVCPMLIYAEARGRCWCLPLSVLALFPWVRVSRWAGSSVSLRLAVCQAVWIIHPCSTVLGLQEHTAWPFTWVVRFKFRFSGLQSNHPYPLSCLHTPHWRLKSFIAFSYFFCMCVGCVGNCPCGSQRTMIGIGFLLHNVGPRVWTQAVKFGRKHLLSHFTCPTWG